MKIKYQVVKKRNNYYIESKLDGFWGIVFGDWDRESYPYGTLEEAVDEIDRLIKAETEAKARKEAKEEVVWP